MQKKLFKGKKRKKKQKDDELIGLIYASLRPKLDLLGLIMYLEIITVSLQQRVKIIQGRAREYNSISHKI